MIADTTLIIDLMRNKSEAIKKIEELEKLSKPLLVTTISVFELWQGSLDIENPERKQKLQAFLLSAGLIPLELESAKIGAIIHGELRKAGDTIQAQDSMIAGICVYYNETIVTRNIKDFSKIKNLVIETD